MKDKSLHNNQQSQGISDSLQSFIDSMVEEIVLEGKPFDSQKKYLKKFSEKEGLDYNKLLHKITSFIEEVNYSINRGKFTQTSIRNLKFLSTDTYITEKTIDEIVNKITIKIEEEVRKIPPRRLHMVEVNSEEYYYVDSKGDIAISDRWVDASGFREGLAAVSRSAPDKQFWENGFIDTWGKVVIPFGKWDAVNPLHEGLAAVIKGNKFGYIDKQGHLAIPLQDLTDGVPFRLVEEDMCGFNSGLARDPNGQGYINKNGVLAIPKQPWWSAFCDFSEGLAAVSEYDGNSDKWGFIDTKGQLVIPCRWNSVGKFGESLCAIQNEYDEWGFIDKLGRLTILFGNEWELFYPEEEIFSEGLCPVRNNEGMYGYIDHTGLLIIPYKWASAENFENGLAWVSLPNEYHYRLINKEGNYVKIDD